MSVSKYYFGINILNVVFAATPPKFKVKVLGKIETL